MSDGYNDGGQTFPSINDRFVRREDERLPPYCVPDERQQYSAGRRIIMKRRFGASKKRRKRPETMKPIGENRRRALLL